MHCASELRQPACQLRTIWPVPVHCSKQCLVLGDVLFKGKAVVLVGLLVARLTASTAHAGHLHPHSGLPNLQDSRKTAAASIACQHLGGKYMVCLCAWIVGCRSAAQHSTCQAQHMCQHSKGQRCCKSTACEAQKGAAPAQGAECTRGPGSCSARRPPGPKACLRTCAGAGAAACCGVPSSEGPHAALGPSMLSASAICCAICCRTNRQQQLRRTVQHTTTSNGWAGNT